MKEAIARFEAYLKSRYPGSATAKQYVNDLRLVSQLIKKPARAISKEDIDCFVEDQLERGLAGRTVNRRLTALRELFEYLAGEELGEEWPNPVSGKRHKVKASKPLPREVGEADIERLFAQISQPRDKAMFRLMLAVGLRVEEVAKLRVGDVMEISPGTSRRLRVRGKGGKERYVWLLAESWEVVQDGLEQRPSSSDEALFVSHRKKRVSLRGIQERLAHSSRQAGVEVSPHQLRHSFGRRMAEAEMPVSRIAALMGQAQLKTTQIYIAGAGVEIQADYQAALERLEAARLESSQVWGNETQAARKVGQIADVWTLAGLERQRESKSYVEAEETMDLSRYWEGLPDWLAEHLQAYITYRQGPWKPNRVGHYTADKLSHLRQFWCWLLERETIDSLAELGAGHVQGFIEAKLAAGLRSSSVNAELKILLAFLRYCQEHGQAVRPSVFRVKRLKPEDSLPRFLTASDYQRLESHILQATQGGEGDDWLDRLWFYLLSEAGLRVGEVCELALGNIDLVGQKLTVRASKGRERTLPLSPTVISPLKAYLPLRGEAHSNTVLTLRGQAIQPSLIRSRLQRYGQQVQVQVSPHRLRHTLATRLLNAGMPITSIQHLLGHETLNTTLLYAQVHNETVQRDFERAHARLSPASSLADELFNAPTNAAESQPLTTEVNCV